MCSINEQLVEEASFLQKKVWKLEDEVRKLKKEKESLEELISFRENKF